LAEYELFAWWSEMIEVPIVAEGGLSADIVRYITPVTDFLAFGDEIWGTDAPSEALTTLLEARD
jgi:thiamine-phosphate pyrophosphorylase